MRNCGKKAGTWNEIAMSPLASVAPSGRTSNGSDNAAVKPPRDPKLIDVTPGWPDKRKVAAFGVAPSMATPTVWPGLTDPVTVSTEHWESATVLRARNAPNATNDWRIAETSSRMGADRGEPARAILHHVRAEARIVDRARAMNFVHARLRWRKVGRFDIMQPP
jgi:hypothetical protein